MRPWSQIVTRLWLFFNVFLLEVHRNFAENENESKFTTMDVFPTEIVPYVRHPDLKRYRTKDLFLHDRFNNPLLDLDLKYCRRPAKCQPLNNSFCMGSKLPYHQTTLDLTDLDSQEEIQEKLQLYHYLRFIPKCWAVIQPFLCALYLPKCEDGQVDLPSKEMCRITLGPCRILYNTTVFPEFMKCEDSRLFPSKCKNDIQEVKFNTTGFCLEPLVKTDHPDWFYPGNYSPPTVNWQELVRSRNSSSSDLHRALSNLRRMAYTNQFLVDVEGCGLECKDILYNENEHRQIHKLVGYFVFLCITLNLFAVCTFLIERKTSSKYPALAIFYANVCFLISYCGWLVQFLGVDTREDIVCKKDGTLRMHEPSANENLSCASIFVMTYYFLNAGMVWFGVFTFAWRMSTLQALGKIQERVDKKRAYFHLIGWSVPLILTITTMAFGEIDGNYVLGICFVGFHSKAARIGLLLAPLAAYVGVAGYNIIRGLIVLIKVKIISRDIISQHSSRKIRSNIVRMGVFALFMIVFCIIIFLYHIHVFANQEIWNKSLHEYILCKLTSVSMDYSHCKVETRPSVAMLQLLLLAVFGAGIAVASWVWCPATFRTWARYLRRKFHCQVDEPVYFQKHRIIAQAFEKRREFNEGRKISIECQRHSDPVGLDFDLNSAASKELSTAWAANLPRLVNRRGAVPNEAVTWSASSNSEMNYSLQRISIESRRNSGESQLSVEISELKATRKVKGGRHRKWNRRKQYGLAKRSRSGSADSVLTHQLLTRNILKNAEIKPVLPDLNKRRVGNAGLDGQTIQTLLSNTKLILPRENHLQRSHSEENLSVTISESKFNMVVNNHSNNNLDLSDQLIMKSLKQGLKIKEVNSSTNSYNESDY